MMILICMFAHCSRVASVFDHASRSHTAATASTIFPLAFSRSNLMSSPSTGFSLSQNQIALVCFPDGCSPAMRYRITANASSQFTISGSMVTLGIVLYLPLNFLVVTFENRILRNLHSKHQPKYLRL